MVREPLRDKTLRRYSGMVLLRHVRQQIESQSQEEDQMAKVGNWNGFSNRSNRGRRAEGELDHMKVVAVFTANSYIQGTNGVTADALCLT
jgi:hypothetical protein